MAAGRQGRRTTAAEREKILASYLLTGNISTTAQDLGFSTSTVHRIVHDAEKRGSSSSTQPQAATSSGNTPDSSPSSSGLATEHSGPPLLDPEMVEAALRAGSWPLVSPVTKTIERIYADLAKAKDETLQKNLLQQLYQASLSYGILVDKARLLNDRSTSIIAKQRELETLPPGFTRETLIALVRERIYAVASAHVGLLPEAASGG